MLEEFEFLMESIWEQSVVSETSDEEQEDPTQGDEIRTPWGGLVD